MEKAHVVGKNYKVNGEVCHFETVDELLKFLTGIVKDLKEPLTVEPLDGKDFDYDHMQEILNRAYHADAIVKGIMGIALHVQEEGAFRTFGRDDIGSLATQCGDLMNQIFDIAEVARNIYQSECEAREKRREERKTAVDVERTNSEQMDQKIVKLETKIKELEEKLAKL